MDADDRGDMFTKLAKKQIEAKEPKEARPPQLARRLKMQLGMPIDFHGYRYVVTKIYRRNRIMLKLMGELKEGDQR